MGGQWEEIAFEGQVEEDETEITWTAWGREQTRGEDQIKKVFALVLKSAIEDLSRSEDQIAASAESPYAQREALVARALAYEWFFGHTPKAGENYGCGIPRVSFSACCLALGWSEEAVLLRIRDQIRPKPPTIRLTKAEREDYLGRELKKKEKKKETDPDEYMEPHQWAERKEGRVWKRRSEREKDKIVKKSRGGMDVLETAAIPRTAEAPKTADESLLIDNLGEI